jgi:hypothetical protein
MIGPEKAEEFGHFSRTSEVAPCWLGGVAWQTRAGEPRLLPRSVTRPHPNIFGLLEDVFVRRVVLVTAHLANAQAKSAASPSSLRWRSLGPKPNWSRARLIQALDRTQPRARASNGRADSGFVPPRRPCRSAPPSKSITTVSQPATLGGPSQRRSWRLSLSRKAALIPSPQSGLPCGLTVQVRARPSVTFELRDCRS